MSALENIFAIISFGVRKVIVHGKTEVLYVAVMVSAIRLATFHKVHFTMSKYTLGCPLLSVIVSYHFHALNFLNLKKFYDGYINIVGKYKLFY